MKPIYCILSLLLLLSCNSKTTKTIQLPRPNILFLLADDLGYGELGCYGQEIVKTPFLDKLAKEGIMFTNFYAGSSVCAPSRAVLMTGIQSTFNSIRGNSGYNSIEDSWDRIALDKNHMTMAEMLRDTGYQTAFIGKWHLDDANDVSTWAYARGFDYAVQEQWSMRHGGRSFTKDMEYINGLQDSIFYEVDEWQSKDEFRTELALNYLEKLDEEKPFFLFMSFRAPHGHERTLGNKTLYADKGWKPKERLHAAKITLLDQQVGRFMDKLESLGQLENTLVIFTSDNGPHLEGGHDPEFFNSNGPFKGYKRDMYEGGLRVPMIAYWKGKLEAGSTNDFLGSFQDLMPTLAEVAKTEIPGQSNGLSLLPVLMGENTKTHNYLAWEIQLDGHWQKMVNGGFRQGVRMDNWKAVRYGTNTKLSLYNLDNDKEESRDLAKELPGISLKMEEIMLTERSDNEKFPFGGVETKK